MSHWIKNVRQLLTDTFEAFPTCSDIFQFFFNVCRLSSSASFHGKVAKETYEPELRAVERVSKMSLQAELAELNPTKHSMCVSTSARFRVECRSVNLIGSP